MSNKFYIWCIWINIFHGICRCVNRVTAVQPPVSDNIVIEMSFDRERAREGARAGGEGGKERQDIHFNDSWYRICVKAINVISLVYYSTIFCVNKWLTHLGNPILLQFTFHIDSALKRMNGALSRASIFESRIPFSLGEPRVLISLIARGPAGSDRVIRALGYSTIRRNNSLISRRQASREGGDAGRRCAGPRRVTTNLFGCYSCRNYEIQCGEFAC